MAKDWISRSIYLVFFLLGFLILLQGHLKHVAENNILGTALIGTSLFFAHWPLSWKAHQGVRRPMANAWRKARAQELMNNHHWLAAAVDLAQMNGSIARMPKELAKEFLDCYNKPDFSDSVHVLLGKSLDAVKQCCKYLVSLSDADVDTLFELS